MRITEIKYGYTFNAGNFRSERIDLAAEIDETENADAALLTLKAKVMALGGDMHESQLATKQAQAIAMRG